jgi:hypothetical protein
MMYCRLNSKFDADHTGVIAPACYYIIFYGRLFCNAIGLTIAMSEFRLCGFKENCKLRSAWGLQIEPEKRAPAIRSSTRLRPFFATLKSAGRGCVRLRWEPAASGPTQDRERPCRIGL